MEAARLTAAVLLQLRWHPCRNAESVATPCLSKTEYLLLSCVHHNIFVLHLTLPDSQSGPYQC